MSLMQTTYNKTSCFLKRHNVIKENLNKTDQINSVFNNFLLVLVKQMQA